MEDIEKKILDLYDRVESLQLHKPGGKGHNQRRHGARAKGSGGGGGGVPVIPESTVFVKKASSTNEQFAAASKRLSSAEKRLDNAYKSDHKMRNAPTRPSKEAALKQSRKVQNSITNFENVLDNVNVIRHVQRGGLTKMERRMAKVERAYN
jgi:hypothetical protein